MPRLSARTALPAILAAAVISTFAGGYALGAQRSATAAHTSAPAAGGHGLARLLDPRHRPTPMDDAQPEDFGQFARDLASSRG